jgi:hypothetical protein
MEEGHIFADWEVADDGVVVLDFVADGEEHIKLRLSINQIGALAMTLPELASKAFRRRSGNQETQYVYPLASWKVEQSTDPRTGMVTLGTADGFSVCFSMSRELQIRLGEAIASERLPNAATLAN